LQTLRQQVAQALDTANIHPPNFTVQEYGAERDAGGRKTGAVTGSSDEGACDNSLQIVLHDAILHTQPSQAPQLRTEVGRPPPQTSSLQHAASSASQLLLLQLSAQGLERPPFRKLISVGDAQMVEETSVQPGGTASRLSLNTVIQIREGGGKRSKGGRGGEHEKELDEQAGRLVRMANGEAHLAVYDMQRALLGGFK